MSYKETLNLPKTDFPMKANLPQREPDTEKFWQGMDIYARIIESRPDDKRYTLHDGPPYANGHIHIGHALNKTLKDIVIKYKTMRGFRAAYIPGWDCHGLPVEHQLLKKLKIRKEQIGQAEFRKSAHDYAMGFVDIQREEFERLGVFADWQRPYLTLDKAYEESIIRSFGKLVEAGYIYKGLKPVNYCYRCETALAEAEVEYEDHTSPSVYVKFKLKSGCQLTDDAYMLIWTTTPWTLIANVAIAVHPDSEYAKIETTAGNLILAKSLLDQVAEASAIDDYKVLDVVKGKELEGAAYEHPFGLREGKVVLADYVSMEEGTGCVHTAPGHGQDDYATGLKYKLDVVMPVDGKGNFTEEAAEFKGMNVHKANPVIIDKLKQLKALLHSDSLTHSYPHCWRCKSPIIFRATEQWFMSVDHNGLRKKVLGEIEKVRWVPSQGQERISSMVEGRPDWCLSRQRYWGVPIPVLLCKKCDKPIADSKFISHFADIVKEKGCDAWFTMEMAELLPKGYRCPHCSGSEFERGRDILDVWFESGVSHQAVVKGREELSFPADLYLEGSDQHRGWFQSALITSMAIDGESAFKSVLTHGFVVDGEGRKMSKSLGNVLAPQDIIKHYGADILRLWVASSDYKDDVRISDKILARLTEAYRKIRNTGRFILGNLYDFDPERDAVDYEKLLEVDKWAVSRAHSLLKDIAGLYEGFQFHKIYHALYGFCITDMSNFYLDVVKDRLYISKSDSLERRSCQTAMHEILKVIINAIAPILVFTAEEMWQNMPRDKQMPESVHLSAWPDAESLKSDKALEAKWQGFIEIRDAVLKVLELKRGSGIIGSSLEAKVIIYTESDEIYASLKDYEQQLSALFIVSQALLLKEKAPADALGSEDLSGVFVKVDKADGEKCPRCWNYSPSVTKDVCQRCQEALRP
ncbi:MAG: isoleucine--tRNA ligase [Candidatus Omnitrophica bacterium]|nr:isoleucine--tRNA ligase [Candidatus Omnitrophota bacterium]